MVGQVGSTVGFGFRCMAVESAEQTACTRRIAISRIGQIDWELDLSWEMLMRSFKWPPVRRWSKRLQTHLFIVDKKDGYRQRNVRQFLQSAYRHIIWLHYLALRRKRGCRAGRLVKSKQTRRASCVLSDRGVGCIPVIVGNRPAGPTPRRSRSPSVRTTPVRCRSTVLSSDGGGAVTEWVSSSAHQHIKGYFVPSRLLWK